MSMKLQKNYNFFRKCYSKEVPFFHVIDVSDFVLFLMEVGALDPYQQQVKIGIDDGQGNDIKQYYFYNQKTFCKFSKKHFVHKT